MATTASGTVLSSASPTGSTSDRRCRGDLVERFDPVDDFNFAHFRMRHMAAELIRTRRHSGIAPGTEAPDFELPTVDGASLRLSDLRRRPVLLHLVSYTCPVTRGSGELMRNLHRRYGGDVQFVDIVVRQAHPGEHHGTYTSLDQKLDDARRYQQEERVTWPVAVDDLDGTVQRAYGGMSASAYLLDGQGRVVHYAMWGPTPRLASVVDDLLRRGDGVVRRTIDAVPHLGGAIVLGQGGPARGGIRSFVDLELGFPGAMLLMSVGRILRPTVRSRLDGTSPRSDRRRRRGWPAWMVAIGAGALALAGGTCYRHRAACRARAAAGCCRCRSTS